jgi:Na+-driven multidrug efflux pump
MDRSTRYRSRNSSFPITFLISSLGMAIGVGGGSVLSRFRCKIVKKQNYFANQIMMTFLLASVLWF